MFSTDPWIWWFGSWFTSRHQFSAWCLASQICSVFPRCRPMVAEPPPPPTHTQTLARTHALGTACRPASMGLQRQTCAATASSLAILHHLCVRRRLRSNMCFRSLQCMTSRKQSCLFSCFDPSHLTSRWVMHITAQGSLETCRDEGIPSPRSDGSSSHLWLSSHFQVQSDNCKTAVGESLIYGHMHMAPRFAPGSLRQSLGY